jgi:acylphosphatase
VGTISGGKFRKMNQDENARLHAIIEGRVQGVSFRYFVQQNANALDLSGWVRNRYDGTVEVVAEGPRRNLENLLSHLRRGPRSANVTGVSPQWQEATGEFDRFRVRMTR